MQEKKAVLPTAMAFFILQRRHDVFQDNEKNA